ncbi:hypothetical protein CR513_35922, partial [Mucuna pruriens]
MKIFVDPSKVGEINDTLIALITKIDRIHNINNFRLINLCNVTYKTRDSLSPYLFVLCIERLFQLINVVKENKIMHHIQISQERPINSRA